MTVTIGQQCRQFEDDVRRILNRYQKQGKPAWFDGSFIYGPSGKYSVDPSNIGRFQMTYAHDLSVDGLFRWFEPSEHVCYNDDMLAGYELRRKQREEQEKLVRADYLEEQDKEHQNNLRRQELTCQIDELIDSAKIRGKNQEYSITLSNTETINVNGTVYGYFGVRKHDTLKWVVDHLNSGQRAGSHFGTKKDACRYVFALNLIADWGKIVHPKDIRVGVGSIAFKLQRYFRHDKTDVKDLEAILTSLTKRMSKIWKRS